MTTIVAVKKGSSIAMAADTLTTFGDMRLSHAYKGEHDKILQFGGSLLGVCGSSAHHLVLSSLLKDMPAADIKLGSRLQVYEFFLKLHPQLKERFFLNSKEDDDDPYESSQMTVLIANATGIYGVYSYREVFEFERFWGVGSGRDFALGAMFSIYDGKLPAEKIAETGVRSGIEFDRNSGPPYEVFSVKLNAKK